MRTDDVIAHFGSRKAVEEALDVSQAAISQWKKRGKVPKLRALEVERLTKRKLRFDPHAYDSERVA